MRTVTLNNGVEMPILGFGVFQIADPVQCERAVSEALAAGYRLIDTAAAYGNERGVGDGLRDSGLDRGDVWVTTKFNRRWHTDVLGGLAGNLERLGLDYVDLALIHWPNPDQDRYVDAWRGLSRLREEGVVRAIGTSNFKPAHLDRLIAETGVAPEVNQIELHPYLDRAEERAYHAAHGIVTEAWSPLGRGNGLLEQPLVTSLASKYGVTPGQVLLAWDVVQGIVTIPKSSNPERLRQNLDIFGIDLDADEVASLTALSAPGVEAVDSDVFGH